MVARLFRVELDGIKLFEVYLAVAIETAYSSASSSAILPLFPCPFFSAVAGRMGETPLVSQGVTPR